MQVTKSQRRELFDQLSHYQLHEKDSPPWSNSVTKYHPSEPALQSVTHAMHMDLLTGVISFISATVPRCLHVCPCDAVQCAVLRLPNASFLPAQMLNIL